MFGFFNKNRKSSEVFPGDPVATLLLLATEMAHEFNVFVTKGGYIRDDLDFEISESLKTFKFFDLALTFIYASLMEEGGKNRRDVMQEIKDRHASILVSSMTRGDEAREDTINIIKISKTNVEMCICAAQSIDFGIKNGVASPFLMAINNCSIIVDDDDTDYFLSVKYSDICAKLHAVARRKVMSIF